MTEEEKLTYLTRCQCLACTEREETRERSLEQLYLDSVFASMKAKLMTHVFEQIHEEHQKLAGEFINIVKKQAEALCHEAFDASCEYGFAKKERENESI